MYFYIIKSICTINYNNTYSTDLSCFIEKKDMVFSVKTFY